MEVGICKTRDLRKMCHAQNLTLLRKPPQPAADRLGYPAPYPGVNLVKHIRAAVVTSVGRRLQGGLERERDSGEFTTRGDLAKRPGGLA